MTTYKIGYWAALFSFFFAIAYSIPQLLSAFRIIHYPHDLFWLYLPSLFLAPAFTVTMICLHYSANEGLKIWTALGAAFAIIYCPLVSLVYFSQLAVFIPALLNGEINDSHILFVRERTFLMSVDCLGYFFMSVSTFFAAFAFKQAQTKWLYRGLLWNGLLMPVIILAFFFSFFYYIGALWMITFPFAMINAGKMFKAKFTNLQK